jgi:hypothetical protein
VPVAEECDLGLQPPDAGVRLVPLVGDFADELVQRLPQFRLDGGGLGGVEPLGQQFDLPGQFFLLLGQFLHLVAELAGLRLRRVGGAHRERPRQEDDTQEDAARDRAFHNATPVSPDDDRRAKD